MHGVLQQSCRHIFIDVSTLMETHWTGIAVVTAEICRQFLARFPQSTHFFAFGELVEKRLIEIALLVNDSTGLMVLFEAGRTKEAVLENLDAQTVGNGVAIYPNFKRGHIKFGHEIIFVHDLSFGTMPELHDPNATYDYRNRLYRDCCNADLVFCNSQATMMDVNTYFGIDVQKLRYSHLGCRYIEPDAESIRIVERMERFCLVVGTLEPRKNIEIVLRYLSGHRELLENLKFVFVGREGWGPKFKETLTRYGLSTAANIKHLGFVTEGLKWALLARAHLVLYPSFFEGFGLPIVEGMSAGAIVCAGITSSVVELGLAQKFLFDPCSETHFSDVIATALNLSADERRLTRMRNARVAKRFTWERFGQDLATAAFSDVENDVFGSAERASKYPVSVNS